jgi:hypothetical protein
MRFVLFLGLAALALAFFSGRAGNVFDRGGSSPEASVSKVNDILEKAAAGEPLDGRPAPDGAWVRRMTAACEKRERLLAGLPRATTPGGIADRGTQILAIHATYAARVAALRPPSAYRAEAREIRAFNAAQQRTLRRVVAAGQAGNLGAASRRAVALRELAGRANSLFLRLGLDRCAFGAAGMPV